MLQASGIMFFNGPSFDPKSLKLCQIWAEQMLAWRAKYVAVYVLAIKGTPVAKVYCSELATIMQNFGEKPSRRIFAQSKNQTIFKQAGPNHSSLFMRLNDKWKKKWIKLKIPRRWENYRLHRNKPSQNASDKLQFIFRVSNYGTQHLRFGKTRSDGNR